MFTAAVCREHHPIVGVQAADGRLQAQVDALLGVPGHLADDRPLGEGRLLQDAGQGDPVVEGVGLIRQDGDDRLGVRLADRLGGGGAGHPVADDHVARRRVRSLGHVTRS